MKQTKPNPIKPTLLLLAAITTLHTPLQTAPPQETETPIKKIVFGSCHVQHFKPSPIWESIKNENPDLLMLLGDNAYIDSYNENKHRQAYQTLKEKHGFQEILNTIPTLAIWDDHDYGRNDDGDNNPEKEKIQKIFLEELEIPKNRRPWKHPGIYDSYTLGKHPQKIQILLLDTRTFRSPLAINPKGKYKDTEGNTYGKYTPHTSTTPTLLGEKQWQWLQEELQKPADIRIIASSIQVLSNLHGWESWGNFPQERTRLLKLLETSEGKPLILSGDRHLSEISRIQTKTGPLYDLTSSPLLSYTRPTKEKNPNRVGKAINTNNYATLEVQNNRLKVTYKTPKGKTLKTHTIDITKQK
jgi:alkaline phosphatase D